MIRRELTLDEARRLGLVAFMDSYEFSDTGNAFSIHTGRKLTIDKLNGSVVLSEDNRKIKVYLSVIIALMFVDDYNPVTCRIIHKDGNIANCNINNMTLVYGSGNNRSKSGYESSAFHEIDEYPQTAMAKKLERMCMEDRQRRFGKDKFNEWN